MSDHGGHGEHGGHGGGGHGGGGGGLIEKLFTEVVEGVTELGWETGLGAANETLKVIQDVVSTGKSSKGGGHGGGGGHGHH